MISFDQNKADLLRGAPLIIKQVVEEFGVRNDPRIEVRGHADKSETAGQAISQLRAKIVKEALISAGIPDGAITTSSFGATRPLVIGEDGWSAALNRRVEIITFWTAGATAYFDWGQSELSPTAVEATKQFAEKYRNRTDGLIKVMGRSNKAEPDAIGLSLRRAGAVVKMLVTEGVSTSSIVLKGTGGDDQVYPEISGKIEPKNRQVEVTFARR